MTRELESLLDVLGPLRDAQNDRSRAKRARGGAGVEPLRRHLERRVARYARRARPAVTHAGGARIRKDAARLRAAIVAGARADAAARHLRLTKVVDLASVGVRNRLARFDVDRPRSVHRLRIALREFRYTVEIAVRLSPAVRVRGQTTVLELQGRLGRAHDAEVLLDRLDRFAHRHPGRAGPALDALRLTLASERDRDLAGLGRALTSLEHALTADADRAASRRRPTS
jgi:CHAD domain-containing protein